MLLPSLGGWCKPPAAVPPPPAHTIPFLCRRAGWADLLGGRPRAQLWRALQLTAAGGAGQGRHLRLPEGPQVMTAQPVISLWPFCDAGRSVTLAMRVRVKDAICDNLRDPKGGQGRAGFFSMSYDRRARCADNRSCCITHDTMHAAPWLAVCWTDPLGRAYADLPASALALTYTQGRQARAAGTWRCGRPAPLLHRLPGQAHSLS